MKIFFNKKLMSLCFVVFFIHRLNYPQDAQVKELRIGNLALPSSQQPGPLIGFGQNMLDKGDLQFFSYVDYLRGHNKQYTEIIPTLLYGFTDDFSLFLQLPIAVKFKEDGTVFRGIQEAIIQFEYSFYNRTTLTKTNQISLVSNIALTPDSPAKNIRRGLAVTNFFLGFTASHMSTDWYPFASVGMLFATRDDAKTKYGNQVLYECGLSKNICYKENKYIFNWMIEFDGFYYQKDKVCGAINQNSGGNTMLLGPSFWFSSSHFSMQAGISWVIFEHLNGIQNSNKYYIAVDCGYKF